MKSISRFRFGPDQYTAAECILVGIPTRDRETTIPRVDIFDINILFLTGLDTLTKYRMSVDTVRDKLCLPIQNIDVPLTRNSRHIYLERSKHNFMLFTKQEFIKLYRGSSHPSDDVLLNPLHLARPSEVNSTTNLILESIVKHCTNFQHYGPSPLEFKAAISTEEKIGFWRRNFCGPDVCQRNGCLTRRR